MATTGSKICTVCGTDLTSRQRVKDAQGRYACAGACQKELFGTLAVTSSQATPTSPVSRSEEDEPSPVAPPTRARPAALGPAHAAPQSGERGGRAVSERKPPVAVPAETDETEMMARILDELPPAADGKVCPGCQNAMASDAVVCVSCGMNTQTGEQVRTKVIKQKKVAKKSSGSRQGSSSSSGVSVGTYFVATAGFYALVGLSASFSREVFSAMVVLALLINLVNWVSAVFTAFRDGEPGWGACGLLTLVPYIRGVAALIFLVYSCFLCSSGRVRGMSMGIFVGIIIGVVLIFVMGDPELVKGMQNFFDRR
jgi:hypothetical protein